MIAIFDELAALAYLHSCKAKGLEALRDIQESRLRSLIAHAYRNSPYYRSEFGRHGIAPGDITGIGDLKKIPVLTKGVVRASWTRIACRAAGRGIYCLRTSGATGEPANIIYDRKALAFANALVAYVKSVFGLSLFDSEVRFHVPEPGMMKSFPVKAGIFKRHDIDTSLPLEVAAGRYNLLRPRSVSSSPSFLLRLIAFSRKARVRLWRPEYVFIHSEPCSHAARMSLERFFGSRVYSIYGSTELFRIAYECPSRKGMHLMSPAAVIELLDRSGNWCRAGQPGRVVITSLLNHAMPLIRYDTGDMAIPKGGGCACGLSWPVIESRIVRSPALPQSTTLP